MQNSADQRATGGAVLGYAFLTIDNGQMSLEPGGSIQNAEPKYGFPGIKLPAAVDWYLKNVPKQFPRLSNLNFTPDFPSNAQAWAALLGQGAKRHIDGAIAVDPVAVAQLLGSKKIHLPVLTDPISGSNLVQVAENQQYFLPHDDQLLFPAQLIAAAWPVLKDLHPFLRVVRTMGQVLGTKNIQNLVRRRGPGGVAADPRVGREREDRNRGPSADRGQQAAVGQDRLLHEDHDRLRRDGRCVGLDHLVVHGDPRQPHTQGFAPRDRGEVQRTG